MSAGGSLESAHAALRAVCAAPPPWDVPGASTDRTAEAHRDAAVLVLFGVLDAVPAKARDAVVARELDVLLTRRADTLTSHAGQVSFPGGRIDPEDDGAVAAALREAREETGLDPAGVEVLGSLPDLPVSASRHWVTPVLGWWSAPTPVRVVDPRESAAVFRAPVADLVDPRHRRTVRHRTPAGWYRSPGFVVGEHLVWGFTALVLDRLLTWTGWAVPWDDSPTVDMAPTGAGWSRGPGATPPGR